jgi:hypothetical protein
MEYRGVRKPCLRGGMEYRGLRKPCLRGGDGFIDYYSSRELNELIKRSSSVEFPGSLEVANVRR